MGDGGGSSARMNRAIRFVMSSGMSVISFVVVVVG
jgi:hypothetical protein